jgi:hypothetical protein
MKANGRVDSVEIHVFVSSALVVGEWSASRPDQFTPGEGAKIRLGRRHCVPQNQFRRRVFFIALGWD